MSPEITTPIEQANDLISSAAEIDTKKAELIERLKRQRVEIDTALAALGVGRERKAKRGPGRPVGSKNRPKAEVQG